MKAYFSRQYLNCYQSNVLYDFLKRKIPVDYLFYNTLENTDKIYSEVFLNNVPRWKYSNKLFDDLHILGIKQAITEFDSFHKVKEFILSRIKENKLIFVCVRNSFIPYLIRNGYPPEGIHFITITGYIEENDSFIITDAPLMIDGVLESNILESSFNTLPKRMKFTIQVDYDDYNFNETHLVHFNYCFKSILYYFQDNFTFYDLISEMLINTPSKELFEKIEESFSIICGSKFLLAKYLEANHYTNDLIDIIKDISINAEIVRNSATKIKNGGKMNIDSLINRCDILKSLETSALELLRIESNKVPEVNAAHNNINLQITILSVSDTSARLEWSQPLERIYIKSYELYIDKCLITSSALNTCNINNLDPSSSYYFEIKIMDIFGNLINCEPGITINTRGENLAKNKVVYSSSDSNFDLRKENIIDGIETTRWSSEQEQDPQWICIDLGKEEEFDCITIYWEHAYAKKYFLQVSTDYEKWDNIYFTSEGEGGIEEIKGLKSKGRYVRMYGLERGTPWGYSIWDFSIY